MSLEVKGQIAEVEPGGFTSAVSPLTSAISHKSLTVDSRNPRSWPMNTERGVVKPHFPKATKTRGYRPRGGPGCAKFSWPGGDASKNGRFDRVSVGSRQHSAFSSSRAESAEDDGGFGHGPARTL